MNGRIAASAAYATSIHCGDTVVADANCRRVRTAVRWKPPTLQPAPPYFARADRLAR
jgi:hypothetical protein